MQSDKDECLVFHLITLEYLQLAPAVPKINVLTETLPLGKCSWEAFTLLNCTYLFLCLYLSKIHVRCLGHCFQMVALFSSKQRGGQNVSTSYDYHES